VAFVLRVCRSRAAVVIAVVLASAAFAAGGSLSGIHFVRNWIGVGLGLLLVVLLLPVLRFNFASWLALYLAMVAAGRFGGMWRHEGFRPLAIEAAIGLVLAALIALAWAFRAGRAPALASPEPVASVPGSSPS